MEQSRFKDQIAIVTVLVKRKWDHLEHLFISLKYKHLQLWSPNLFFPPQNAIILLLK